MRVKTNLIMMLALLTAGTLFAQSDMGILYYRMGDYQNAKVYLEKENSANPSENSFYLGELAFAEGDLQKAESFYNKGLSENPANIQNRVGLIKLKLKVDSKEALAAFNALQKEIGKKNFDLALAIGRAYLDNNMRTQASFRLNEARKLNPKHPELYILEGDILMAQNDVKVMGDAAGKYEMSNYYQPDFILGYLKTAQVYERINPSVSIEKLKIVLEKDPNNIMAYGMLGKMYTQNGFYKDAIDAYEIYFKSGVYSVTDLERCARAWYFISNEHYEDSKKYAEALTTVDKGLAREPNHFVLNRYKMYIYTKTNNPDQGLPAAEKFFSLREPSGYITEDYKMYATLLNQAKRYEDALAQYDIAINLDPGKEDLYTDAAELARENKDFGKAAAYLKAWTSRKGMEDVVDLSRLGSDYYSAGTTIARNQPLVEKLMKNQQLITELHANNPALLVDSLTNSTTYFAQNYALFYLHKAETVFDTLIAQVPDGYSGYRLMALTKHAINKDMEVGLAKPYYEKVVEIITEKEEELTSSTRRLLIESYNYLLYHYYMKSDKEKTILYCNKALELDPENKNAKLILDDINK